MRLNQSIREDIVISVMEAYRETNPAPVSLEKETGDYYYNKLIKNFKEHLDKIPREYLNLEPVILVNYRGESHRLRFFNEDDELEKRPLFNKYFKSFNLVVYEDDDKLLLDYLKRKDERSDYQEKYNQFQREVEEILRAANTKNQLLEMWPEIEPLLPPYVANPSKGVKLPMIPTSRLNERLGIKD